MTPPTSSTSRIEDFANAVATMLNGCSFVRPMQAVVDYLPEQRLENLHEPILTVTPNVTSVSVDTNASSSGEYQLSILVVSPCEKNELGAWHGFADKLMQQLERNTMDLAAFANAELEPLDESGWLEDGLFIAVITASWKFYYEATEDDNSDSN